MQENNLYYDPLEISHPDSEKISELLEEKKYLEVRSLTEEIPAPDLAELFSELSKRERVLLFRLLPKDAQRDVFVEMDRETRTDLINNFGDAELISVISELYIDDTVDLIGEMPATIVGRILQASTPEDRETINRILNYPKNSAGTIMTTEYVRFRESMTVDDALKHIRRVAQDKETVYTSYVVTADRRLIGTVSARDLLLAEPDVPITEIMEQSVISAKTTDDREEVAALFERYGLLVVPVVDNENRLVGIVTVDDAITVITEESEEDFAKMAAITPTDLPYLRTSVFSLFLSRIPWLLLLMLSATVSSAILTGFEHALPAVLVLFVPMIMGTGGNSGGQASVTVIRGISRGEIEFRDVGRVFLKELLVGVLCAVAIGAATFLKLVLIEMLLLGTPDLTITVALTVSLSIALTILLSKMIGATLPLLATKLHLDPAVMASPFITTLVDAVSLIVYFFVASGILPS